MPIRIMLTNQAAVIVKGDTLDEAFVTKPWSATVGAVSTGGHDIYLKKRHILGYEIIVQSEWDQIQHDARARAEAEARKNPSPGPKPRLVVPGGPR